MKFDDVIKERYSVRDYSEREVEQDKIEKILKAGLLAPTAKNLQPEKIYVIRSNKYLENIRNITKMTYNANVILLVCADKNIVWKNEKDDFDTSVMDTSIIGTHMMLKATELGLGTCWVRAFDEKELKNKLFLPDNIEPEFMLLVGYPSEDAKPNEALHYSRKNIEEVVEYL